MPTIQELLIDSFQRYAHLPALECGDTTIHYRELDVLTDKMARYLLPAGVGKRIGVCTSGRLDTLTACIGVLKARNIFVPIEPGLPEDRIRMILETAEVQMLLTDEANSDRLGRLLASLALPPGLLLLSDVVSPDTIPLPGADREDELYVYFTSGTTGGPKGVLGTNRGLAEFIRWEIEEFGLGPGLRYSQLINPGFDAWLRDVFVPLCSGGTCILPGAAEVPMVATYPRKWLEDNGIAVVHAVPSWFRTFNNDELTGGALPALRYIFLSGERIIPVELDNWYRRIGNRVQLVNFYGPTETTMIKFFYRITSLDTGRDSIPAGKPMPGTNLLLLDKAMRPVPRGMTGEIYIQTTGMTRGYINNPGMTGRNFISSPLFGDGLLYKTGDMGMVLPDGDLVLRGRIDRQVKIAGVRVEPEEIESYLLRHPAVREAAVVPAGNATGNPRLLAYVSVCSPISKEELRTHLSRSLPGSMVPSTILFLENMPLKANGKINYSALPEAADETYQPPATPVERDLVLLWSSVLSKAGDGIGRAADLFMLGGHSLNATILAARVEEQWGIVFPVSQVFATPTLEAMAVAIGSAAPKTKLTIPAAPVRPFYRAAPAQKRMYFLQQYHPESTAYNITTILRVDGVIDIGRFQDVLNRLLIRHPALCTGFMLTEGELYQFIRREVSMAIPQVCIEEDGTAVFNELIRPFDMEKDLLFRVAWLRHTDKVSWLLFDVHHTVCDGTSLGILVNEALRMYEGMLGGDEPRPFIDFSEWINGEDSRRRLADQQEFWLDHLSGELPVIRLPYDFERPARLTLEGRSFQFLLDNRLHRDLKRLALEKGTTFYNVLLSGFLVFLYRLSGQQELIVGTIVAGRKYPAFLQTVGMFANTLALKASVSEGDRFSDILARLDRLTTKAMDNQDLCFDDIVQLLSRNRDASRHPVFDVMFNLQNLDIPELVTGTAGFRRINFEKNISKFDLTLRVIEEDGNCELTFEYNTRLFRPSTIERFAGYMRAIYSTVIALPAVAVSAYSLMGEEETREELARSAGDADPEFAGETVLGLFSKWAVEAPGRAAIEYNRKLISYRDLYASVSELAGSLGEAGVGRGQVVGLDMPHSPELITAMLAILKCGAAFLPLDPVWPEDRKRRVLENGGAVVLLRGKDRLHHTGFMPATSPEQPEEDIAYLLYTSGTSGTPKGVRVSNQSLSNYISFCIRVYVRQEKEVFGFFTPLSFDLTLTSIFAPLASGNKLVIYRPGINDALLLAEILRKDEVTVLKMTPSHLRILNSLPSEVDRLKTIIAGGENLSYDLALATYRKFRGRVALFNEYGPTEATVGCMCHAFNPGEVQDSVPIGRPLPNNYIYLLGPHMMPVPPGVAGEIYIGGAQVALGYANDPELTALKFPADPFRSGGRLYRTGDLARRLPDGSLVYLGRMDEQIKWRGYRIEPGEIESRLAAFDGVTAAVVAVAGNEEDGTVLTAWFTSDAPIPAAALREFLAAKLPQFMIPGRFVRLDELPLTANGKVDKDSLLRWVPAEGSDRQAAAAGREDSRDHASVMAALLRTWSGVLRMPVTELSADSDFFVAGGHSLAAISLITAIQRDLGAMLTIGDIFDTPVLKEQATLILRARLAGAGDPVQDAAGMRSRPVRITGRKSYPLSAVQRRLYFLYQLDPESTGYNIPFVFSLDGKPDESKVLAAFQSVVDRHENFRTRFSLEYGMPRQFIANHLPVMMDRFEGVGVDAALRDFVRPFRLEEGILIRLGWLKDPTDSYFLLVDMHHIVADELTCSRLLMEFARIYAGVALPPPALHYKDYATWQQEDPQHQERIAAQRQFWLQTLAGELPFLSLPADYSRPPVKRYDGNVIRIRIDPARLAALNAIAARYEASLYMLLVAAYHILLSKLCGTEDVIAGTITSGRREEELNEMMGVVVNTIVLRTRPEAGMPFGDYLLRVRRTVLQAFENQDYPYEDLLEDLHIERDLSRNPLFEANFNMHGIEQAGLELEDLRVTPVEIHTPVTKFDLNLQVNRQAEALILNFYYSTVLFKQETVARLAAGYDRLLQVIERDTDCLIGNMSLMDVAARELVVHGFNATGACYDRAGLIHRLFEERALIQPGSLAVTDPGGALSYESLNVYANRLAHRLIENGAGPGRFVGISMDRSVYTVAAVLAVLKTGAAYVPLEPSWPDHRIGEVVSLLRIGDLLTDAANIEKVMRIGRYREPLPSVYCLDDRYETDSDDGTAARSRNPAPAMDSDMPAYVIFTSGSTGVPKGVSVKHRPVINLIDWVNETFGIDQTTKILFTTSLAFDLSVYDIFGVLAAGGVIRVASREELRDPRTLVDILAKEEISFWDSAPAALQQLMPWFPLLKGTDCRLRLFFLSGDWIPLDIFGKIRNALPDATVTALGGATEATVWSNYFVIDEVRPEWNSIPYGKPIRNARYYILDARRNPCPIGVKGDLYIGGECLASGYINDKELTAAKFVADPFVTGGIMYSTGDKARWFGDGNIEFLGREDAQVKVRGYRIELGEIEHHLLRYPGVTSVKAAVRKAAGGQQSLYAYYLGGGLLPEKDLRDYLLGYLPEYMVPSFFVYLTEMPTTSNGKLDIAALPLIDRQEEVTTSTGALTATEAALALIWAEVLRVSPGIISAETDFFRAGGNSLNATAMLAGVLERFHVGIPLTFLFQKPTIRDLAVFIETKEIETWGPILPSRVETSYRLSSAQRRLFALQYLRPELIAYNILVAFELKGEIDQEALQDALNAVVTLHENLRTSFSLEGSEPVQTVHDVMKVHLEIIAAEGRDPDPLIRNFKKPFELDRAPLFRAGLIRLSSSRHILVFDMHHIISDGVTMDVLGRDFRRCYKAAERPIAGLQYRDYIAWYYQNEQQKIRQQRQFWIDRLSGPLPVLLLPGTDRKIGPPVFTGDSIRFSLGPDLTSRVKELEVSSQSTPFMILYAVLCILLRRLSGQEDIIVGTPVAGRRHPQMKDIAGPFVNVLALRSRPAGDKTFREYLAEVREIAVAALDNQDYPFEDLIGELLTERDWSTNPLFDVFFFVDNIGIGVLEIPGLEVSIYDEPKQTTQYDLMLGMAFADNDITATLSFRTDLFQRALVEQWTEDLCGLIATLTGQPDTPIRVTAPVLTERRRTDGVATL